MSNPLINIIRIIRKIKKRLGSIPRKERNLTRIQEIASSIRQQGTNPSEGQINPLTKKGLNALQSVLLTKKNNNPPSNHGSTSDRSQRSHSDRSQRSHSDRSQRSHSGRSQRSHSGRSQESISSIHSSLEYRENSNDAIIEKLNFASTKILILISIAANTLYINNIIITSQSFISIFQITLFIFFNYINKIEKNNESITEIDIEHILSINNKSIKGMIGGAGYNKKYVLETINILINAKSIPYRNAIIFLFACIFVYVLLKDPNKYDNRRINTFSKDKTIIIKQKNKPKKLKYQ